MRVRRRAMSPTAVGLSVLSLLTCGACGGGLTERDQWTVWVTTDAPMPQLADRVLIDILDETGELACGDCRRPLGVPIDAAGWPFSFGVAVPATGRPVRVRVRLYRATRTGFDGLPRATTTIDHVATLPAATGNTDVEMILRAECLGVASDLAQKKTCAAASRDMVPEPTLALGSLAGPPRPGDWPRAVSQPCTGAPADMVCVPGGFFVFGDATNRASTDPDLSPTDERYVGLSAFAIDRDEVTVGTVRGLLGRGLIRGAPASRDPSPTALLEPCTFLDVTNAANDGKPLNCVSFDVAEQVCGALGKRLPTEAEWEWVAGNLERETRYPWGEAPDVCDRADVGRGRSSLQVLYPESELCRVPVTGPRRPSGLPIDRNPGDVTALGVRHLGGGLSEWVADRLAPYLADCWKPADAFLRDPRCESAATELRVVRGAAWSDAPGFVSSVRRQAARPAAFTPAIGFRCALSRGAPP